MLEKLRKSLKGKIKFIPKRNRNVQVNVVKG